jgi:hypothetical protein
LSGVGCGGLTGEYAAASHLMRPPRSGFEYSRSLLTDRKGVVPSVASLVLLDGVPMGYSLGDAETGGGAGVVCTALAGKLPIGTGRTPVCPWNIQAGSRRKTAPRSHVGHADAGVCPVATVDADQVCGE